MFAEPDPQLGDLRQVCVERCLTPAAHLSPCVAVAAQVPSAALALTCR
ncbi:hypothetical protein SCATT_05220 [Streptantibioticus cattleyicolor NRRL 8057 = DSM 46488]|uniref:Uncharacterized protein n=1 Tax=Streptantibioticus cattleyicolor (strain ATCC 35852 / DSM 46488 / JCM 4925 / NBRC 14057 / NRRL 8057) TaxID=1003195 RepID=G8WPV5_STREN|nr:hypothetical protein SCATT_05220 [Streptantibioticus cattleyicolor NRRL 8057 = DSM 46488]